MKAIIKRSRRAHSGVLSIALLLVCLSLAFPFEANADGWVSGFFGRAFGGDTGLDFSEAIRDRDTWTYGFNTGGMGGGIFGAELDFGYTPKFFGSSGVIDGSGVMTIMGSVIAGIPVGGQSGAGIRPYGVFGVGLIRRSVEFIEIFDDVSTNDFGWNAGAGIMGFFNNTIGLRGEYRYFRNFQQDEIGSGLIQGGHFDFSRASLAFLLRF